MLLKDRTVKLNLFFRGGHSSEILMDKDEAATHLAGLSYKMWDMTPDIVRLHGFINLPLIVKRTIVVNPQELIGIELTENPTIEYMMAEFPDGEDRKTI